MLTCQLSQIGFPKLCNKPHHPKSSGHWRVNWNSLVCCTWMKMPASSGMIIFISEWFGTVLGWMGCRRDGHFLTTSLFFLCAALFPREATYRRKPLWALGAAGSPGRVPLYLLCLLWSKGRGSYQRARDESVFMLGFCSMWLPASKHWIAQPN